MADKRKQRILIADDSEMNRSILADMLGDDYDIIEAENGKEAVAVLQKQVAQIDLVLLDIVMPEMDGFGVLRAMNDFRWIESTPVIMISAESAPARVQQAYELGITDFISRPFDAFVVHHRVVNTLLLYAKQKKLINMVTDQVREKEQQSALMIDILSHIVEFRNGESGQHVLHIRTLTELMLKQLSQMTDKYSFSKADIALISTAAAIHDVGKISIPGEILNKPGRLTDEEFAIMKTHALIGASMLEALPAHQNEPLVRRAYEICRWHHERYDGRGYPDGLKGDEIPIVAQVVALADVYDALTSERVYKKAIPHEKAVQMILNGECGQFNPLLMDCLKELEGSIQNALEKKEVHDWDDQNLLRNLTEELMQREDLSASDRTLYLLEHEREKYKFFADMSQEVQFEYNVSPPSVTISEWGAKHLGLDEIIMDPYHDEKVLATMGTESMQKLAGLLSRTTPENPIVEFDCIIRMGGIERWMKLIARATWSKEEPPVYTGAIGKAIDIHETRVKMAVLEEMAAHDTMTGLYNHKFAKMRIQDMMARKPESNFALGIFDVDYFKKANDTYGHMFGDQVLIHMAKTLKRNMREGTVSARVGGDEFLLFFEYREHVDLAINRIFNSLIGTYESFPISVSMGVAKTQMLGTDYDTLFHAADQALYAAKRGGRGQFRFYDGDSCETLSLISPIDSERESAAENQAGAGTGGKEAESAGVAGGEKAESAGTGGGRDAEREEDPSGR